MLASAAVRSLRIFAATLLIAITCIFITTGAIAQAPTTSPSPTVSPTATATAGGVVSVKPGPPAPYYAAWGLIVLAGITVLAVLGAYLYHAPGFRQRQGRGASG